MVVLLEDTQEVDLLLSRSHRSLNVKPPGVVFGVSTTYEVLSVLSGLHDKFFKLGDI